MPNRTALQVLEGRATGWAAVVLALLNVLQLFPQVRNFTRAEVAQARVSAVSHGYLELLYVCEYQIDLQRQLVNQSQRAAEVWRDRYLEVVGQAPLGRQLGDLKPLDPEQFEGTRKAVENAKALPKLPEAGGEKPEIDTVLDRLVVPDLMREDP